LRRLVERHQDETRVRERALARAQKHAPPPLSNMPKPKTRQAIPAVLEIPSKDSPYDPSQDSLLQRVKMLLGAQ
jgi:vacuolar-type H+-ATPase subunit F/Vma7